MLKKNWTNPDYSVLLCIHLSDEIDHLGSHWVGVDLAKVCPSIGRPHVLYDEIPFIHERPSNAHSVVVIDSPGTVGQNSVMLV